MLYTCSGYNPTYPPPVYCGGNDAYMNNVHDLTIRIGANNPGAIGASILESNSGGIRNVTIKSDDSTPWIGLDLARYQNGPGEAQNVTITGGWHYGIVLGSFTYSVPEFSFTLNHINITSAGVGMANYTQPAFMRDFNYTGSGAALQNNGIGRITLADSVITGGSSSISAIQDYTSGNGVMFLRNIACSGYKSCLNYNGTVVAGSSIKEYTSKSPESQFPSSGLSLNLTPAETPAFTDTNFSADWANVRSFGATGNGYTDDTAAIQAAMNSGKPVVYFPYGTYRVDGNPNPVSIPATVRMVQGLGSCIGAHGNNCISGGDFTNERTPFTSSANGNTIFANFFVDKYDVGCMSYTGAGSFTITDVFNLTCFRGNATGNIFWNNSAVTGATFIGGKFFCVQCNVETSQTHLEFNGTTALVFGMKTEGGNSGCTYPANPCGIVYAHNNAVVEVLGSFFKENGIPDGLPFELINSQVSLDNPGTQSALFHPGFEEVKNNSAPLDLTDTSFYGGGMGTALYTSNTVSQVQSPPPCSGSGCAVPPGTYEISSGGQFVDGGFGFNGANPAVQFYPENDNQFQHWVWDGATFLNVGWSGHFMTDGGDGTVEESTAPDTWSVTSSGGAFTIRNNRTGNYLGSNGGTLFMGSAAAIWTISGSAAPGGSLTGSATTSNAAVNVTAEGTTDWIHWGDTAVTRKSGVKPQLSTYAVVGGSPTFQYSGDPRPESWTDGTPTSSATNNVNGVFTYTVGNGFSFTAPADTTSRKLIVHVGGWNSAGKLRAHLSDGSAVDYTNTATGSTGQYDGNYTLIYNAASAGQTLTVTWTIASGTTGHVSVGAAALQ